MGWEYIAEIALNSKIPSTHLYMYTWQRDKAGVESALEDNVHVQPPRPGLKYGPLNLECSTVTVTARLSHLPRCLQKEISCTLV